MASHWTGSLLDVGATTTDPAFTLGRRVGTPLVLRGWPSGTRHFSVGPLSLMRSQQEEVKRQLELPREIEGIGLIAGVDVNLDMGRTCLNVTGDVACAAALAYSEGEFSPKMVNA